MRGIREQYKALFKKAFHDRLIKTRAKLKVTQAKMAELLFIDDRSYYELEKGKNSCCALTLVFFLMYCCTKEDREEFFTELKQAFQEAESDFIA